MSSKKVILVTGGSGLVGHALQEIVKEDVKGDNETWIFLSSKDADLLSTSETEFAFQKHKPTHVIHLAAMVGGLYHNMRFNLDFLLNNLTMSSNVLHYSHLYGVKKVISCMSTCIYPDKTSYPIDEKMLHDGPPSDTNFGFAHAKRMIDIMNKAYAKQHGCKFTSVIPCNIFGPFDNFSIENGHVMGGLIHKAKKAHLDNTPFEIWGSGTPLRQFIYSKDLARLIIWAMREYEETEPILLSPDESEEVSIENLARMVLKAFDFHGEIRFLIDKPDGQLKKTVSNAKLRKYRPDFMFTPLEEALCGTVKWFIDNYETARK